MSAGKVGVLAFRSGKFRRVGILVAGIDYIWKMAVVGKCDDIRVGIERDSLPFRIVLFGAGCRLGGKVTRIDVGDPKRTKLVRVVSRNKVGVAKNDQVFVGAVVNRNTVEEPFVIRRPTCRRPMRGITDNRGGMILNGRAGTQNSRDGKDAYEGDSEEAMECFHAGEARIVSASADFRGSRLPEFR